MILDILSSIQRYRREYSHYFEVLLQIALKKAFYECFMEFNHIVIDGTIKKTYNSNNKITKTRILVDYYKRYTVSPESLEKLHKLAKRFRRFL